MNVFNVTEHYKDQIETYLNRERSLDNSISHMEESLKRANHCRLGIYIIREEECVDGISHDFLLWENQNLYAMDLAVLPEKIGDDISVELCHKLMGWFRTLLREQRFSVKLQMDQYLPDMLDQLFIGLFEQHDDKAIIMRPRKRWAKMRCKYCSAWCDKNSMEYFFVPGNIPSECTAYTICQNCKDNREVYSKMSQLQKDIND